MKTNLSESNRKYWDQWNIKYSEVWKTAARREMSDKELRYITAKLIDKKPKRILDIGIGNGRILNALSKKSQKNTRIYGIDISRNMVNICKERFVNDSKIVDTRVCDLSKQKIPFLIKFDFVTTIRVLKYNDNWKEMVKKVYNSLAPGGVFIFSMPNNRSISVLSGDKFSEKNIPLKSTNYGELISVLSKIGFSNIDITSFSKLPNFLYHLSENPTYVKTLLISERCLEKLLGKSFLGRELFVTCTK